MAAGHRGGPALMTLDECVQVIDPPPRGANDGELAGAAHSGLITWPDQRMITPAARDEAPRPGERFSGGPAAGTEAARWPVPGAMSERAVAWLGRRRDAIEAGAPAAAGGNG